MKGTHWSSYNQGQEIKYPITLEVLIMSLPNVKTILPHSIMDWFYQILNSMQMASYSMDYFSVWLLLFNMFVRFTCVVAWSCSLSYSYCHVALQCVIMPQFTYSIVGILFPSWPSFWLLHINLSSLLHVFCADLHSVHLLCIWECHLCISRGYIFSAITN